MDAGISELLVFGLKKIEEFRCEAKTSGIRSMKMKRYTLMIALIIIAGSSRAGMCGGFEGKIGFPVSSPTKIVEYSIEMTCTDKPVQLGYSAPVQFRAICPGVWAIIHQRMDESSFRRRFFTYSHYEFKGTWNLRDQGMIESVYTPSRELFIVLPGDLIEFKTADPDCFAKVNIKNLGYLKKASLPELQEWLAYNRYLESVDLRKR